MYNNNEKLKTAHKLFVHLSPELNLLFKIVLCIMV